MQLSYRGVRYSQLKESMDSPVEMVDSGITGTYRGHSYHFSYPRHLSAPASEPTHELVYRGAAYRTTASGIQSASPVARMTRPAARHADNRPMLDYSDKPSTRRAAAGATGAAFRPVNLASREYNNVHRQHIQERLQRRIDAARTRGDQALLQLLEREMQQVS